MCGMLCRMVREGMRVGDGDRQAVADQLRKALDEGRLDLGEYDERLQRVYAAKTFGDLDGLLDDLPGTVPPQHSRIQPAASAAGAVPAPQAPRAAVNQFARWTGPYGGVVLVSVAIWAITSMAAGHLTYFWPMWMLIPMLFGVAGQWHSYGHGGDSRRAEHDARKAERRRRRGR